MPSTSVVEICNRALQKLGAARITSLTQDTPNARSCNVAYNVLRKAELRSHPWSFAIKRAELAADATAPSWGRANSFTLPSDFLRLMDDYPEDNMNNKDWQIEGKKILTDDDAPLYIRYIYDVEDPNEFDSLFSEALSSKIAMELCEEITQSNSKLQAVSEMYKAAIREARRINAIENVAAKPPEDEWITVRT
jgi:hypothetical protein